MAFLMDTIKDLQGGEHDQEAIDRRRYGSRVRVSMPYGFDDPDEGLRKVEDILLFIDEVLTHRTSESSEKDICTDGLKGLGYLCRLMWFMIGDYRTDTFNTLDHLQRLTREKAKQESQEEAGQE